MPDGTVSHSMTLNDLERHGSNYCGIIMLGNVYIIHVGVWMCTFKRLNDSLNEYGGDDGIL